MRPLRPRRALQHGFSFVEMMVACCTSAVLLAAASPSLQQLLAQNQARADVTEFTEALLLARSEALRRGAEVTLCASEAEIPGRAPACRTDGTDWSAGWLLFLDGGERGKLEPGDLMIRVYQRPPTAGKVLAGLRSITFLPIGISSWGNTKVRFMPPGAAGQGANAAALQVVCVNKPGRAKVVVGPDCSG